MKFKAIAIPEPTLGVSFEGVQDQVVPDQDMSLEYILDKFTRGEELPVGMDVQAGDEDIDNPLNVDLEKMSRADLVDKEEFRKELKRITDEHEKQEDEKRKSSKKAAEDARIDKAAKELLAKREEESKKKAEQNSAGSAQ